MAESERPQRERTGGRKHGEKNKYSAATISRDLRDMAIASLHFVGGVKYLAQVAKEEPAAYLSFLTKCLIKDDNSGAGGVTFQVVNLVGNGTPTPGVLNSPIAGDIAPQRPLRLVDSSCDE